MSSEGTRGVSAARALLFIAATLVPCAGCQVLFGFDSITGMGPNSDAGASMEAGTAGTATAGSRAPDAETPTDAGERCGQSGDRRTGLRGQDMVLVVVGERCVWIDHAEVTRSHYAEFLSDETFTPSAGVCDFDPTREIDSECAGSDGGVPEDDLPVTCVDWCDAAAFCEWAGKRLCEGDYLGSTTDARRGEWNFACSTDGASVYPYGAEPNPLACNGKDHPQHGCGAGDCTLWPAGSATTCTTPAGIDDLAGNAAEWTAECQNVLGATDQCNTFGGDANTADVDCSDKVSRARDFRHRLLGFRCCAAQPPPTSAEP